MVDPMHFEAHAAQYARARPPYPPALWDRLRELDVLRPGRRALDLGAGTGQATGPLLAAGLHVTAVEPGPRLASRLRDAHPDATVILTRAEDIELPDASFDAVVAATSIHWMDLDVLLPKVHRLLGPGGVFLVWRNVFGDPDVSTPFRDRVAAIVADRDDPPRRWPDPEEVAATSAALTANGLFSVDETTTFRWSIELDERQVRDLFTTFSDWSADEVDRAGAAVRELGRRVLEHYQSWLIVLRPLDDSPGAAR
ncbi:class I SAM-dependent methyltransferase [Micromonospora sp. DT81.3]|uniref:class I SAM-dependent methyltransferase n=1 Tax=Micromonospora sp. DT81.3 TaxID=3416523 RepID=UPI003CF8291D